MNGGGVGALYSICQFECNQNYSFHDTSFKSFNLYMFAEKNMWSVPFNSVNM